MMPGCALLRGPLACRQRMTERQPGRDQRGMALITGLLLLVVVTLLAVSMFRSFGIQERIAGNVREKQRALHAAESAQQYAEWWLTTGNNKTLVVNCTGMVTASATAGQICTNKLPAVVGDVANVPWTVGGVPVGMSYTPPGMTVGSATGNYSQAPVFYISLMGPQAGGTGGTVYQIDAVGYGGGPAGANSYAAVSVVESTYVVGAGVPQNLNTSGGNGGQ